MEESLPAMAAEVNARIQRLLSLLNTYSPLRMLLDVALRNSIFNPEQYLAGKSENAVVRTEYALSLAASVAQSVEKPEPPDEMVEEFAQPNSPIQCLRSRVRIPSPAPIHSSSWRRPPITGGRSGSAGPALSSSHRSGVHERGAHTFPSSDGMAPSGRGRPRDR